MHDHCDCPKNYYGPCLKAELPEPTRTSHKVIPERIWDSLLDLADNPPGVMIYIQSLRTAMELPNE